MTLLAAEKSKVLGNFYAHVKIAASAITKGREEHEVVCFGNPLGKGWQAFIGNKDERQQQARQAKDLFIESVQQAYPSIIFDFTGVDHLTQGLVKRIFLQIKTFEESKKGIREKPEGFGFGFGFGFGGEQRREEKGPATPKAVVEPLLEPKVPHADHDEEVRFTVGLSPKPPADLVGGKRKEPPESARSVVPPKVPRADDAGNGSPKPQHLVILGSPSDPEVDPKVVLNDNPWSGFKINPQESSPRSSSPTSLEPPPKKACTRGAQFAAARGPQVAAAPQTTEAEFNEIFSLGAPRNNPLLVEPAPRGDRAPSPLRVEVPNNQNTISPPRALDSDGVDRNAIPDDISRIIPLAENQIPGANDLLPEQRVFAPQDGFQIRVNGEPVGNRLLEGTEQEIRDHIFAPVDDEEDQLSTFLSRLELLNAAIKKGKIKPEQGKSIDLLESTCIDELMWACGLLDKHIISNYLKRSFDENLLNDLGDRMHVLNIAYSKGIMKKAKTDEWIAWLLKAAMSEAQSRCRAAHDAYLDAAAKDVGVKVAEKKFADASRVVRKLDGTEKAEARDRVRREKKLEVALRKLDAFSNRVKGELQLIQQVETHSNAKEVSYVETAELLEKEREESALLERDSSSRLEVPFTPISRDRSDSSGRGSSRHLGVSSPSTVSEDMQRAQLLKAQKTAGELSALSPRKKQQGHSDFNVFVFPPQGQRDVEALFKNEEFQKQFEAATKAELTQYKKDFPLKTPDPLKAGIQNLLAVILAQSIPKMSLFVTQLQDFSTGPKKSATTLKKQCEEALAERGRNLNSITRYHNLYRGLLAQEMGLGSNKDEKRAQILSSVVNYLFRIIVDLENKEDGSYTEFETIVKQFLGIAQETLALPSSMAKRAAADSLASPMSLASPPPTPGVIPGGESLLIS